MDDPLLVRRLQRFGHLPGDRQRLIKRKRPLRDSIGQRRTLHELHDERALAARLLEPVNLRDVRIVE
jgi:hypothetical protein